MKTKLFSVVALLMLFSAIQAQSFHLGAKAGANINKLNGKSFKDEFSYGYHVGAFAEIGIGKKFSVQPEVLFNQITYDTSNQFSQIYKNVLSSNRSSIKMNYISIPVLLNYKLSNMLTLQAGPQFGIIKDQSKNLLQNGQDAFKKGDLSLLGGVQLKLSGFRIYGRYAIGLNNLNDIDNQDKWKSQSFQVGIGLAIL